MKNLRLVSVAVLLLSKLLHGELPVPRPAAPTEVWKLVYAQATFEGEPNQKWVTAIQHANTVDTLVWKFDQQVKMERTNYELNFESVEVEMQETLQNWRGQISEAVEAHRMRHGWTERERELDRAAMRIRQDRRWNVKHISHGLDQEMLPYGGYLFAWAWVKFKLGPPKRRAGLPPAF